MKVWFYRHSLIRERHIDTIKKWPTGEVANPQILTTAQAENVPSDKAVSGRIVPSSWVQTLPLPNVKRRPRDAPSDAVIFVWGGITSRGRFIVELDNPYSLVGYNIPAMRLWGPYLWAQLRSERCVEIRCMSEACRKTLGALFGEYIKAKARVIYPLIDRQVNHVDSLALDGPRFLFVGSQFDLKGGPALLKAFRSVRQKLPTARLDLITHLPAEYRALADQPGVRVHPSKMSRQLVWHDFMRGADVLVHPTYVDSFGMVVLEALAHGLAIVATDVYALREMVSDGRNGRLLQPPISIWDGDLPSRLYRRLHRAREEINDVDKSAFENSLGEALLTIGQDRTALLEMRRGSINLFSERFESGKAS